MTRAWVWLVAKVPGATTTAEPSLASLVASTMGYVRPPSRLRRMLTRAQLTGAAVVLATSQVTVWAAPPIQVMAVLGACTTKGPAVLVTSKVTRGL